MYFVSYEIFLLIYLLSQRFLHLNHIENGVVKNSHKISGTNNAIVTADASGNIIIDSAVQTSVTGSSGSCTGNAATATKLANARTINGVSFDGTSNITIPRSTKKIHCAVGTTAKTGYIKFCTLTVTGTYADHAVKFVMSQRSRPPYDLFVQFSSVNSTDCTINVFSYTSNANQGASVYYVKTGTGVFDLYVQKVEAYDHLYVLDVLKADGHEGVQYTITFTDIHATSLPSGYVKASASIQGHTHSYLPLSGGTLTGKTTFSGGLAITTGAENTSMPFFLGIDAYADGGTVKYITASKVCAAIGAAASSHGTHVTFSTTAPKANTGTSGSVGSATTVARSDHAHPLQTTVSGNAGSANKLTNTTDIGSSIVPVYFTSEGVPSVCKYTLSDACDKGVINNTTKGALGWSSSANGASIVPTLNSIAYWNGAYKDTSSNLAYCVHGALGNICTQNSDDYLPVAGGIMDNGATITCSTSSGDRKTVYSQLIKHITPSSSWTHGINWFKTDGTTQISSMGAYGSAANTLTYVYLGGTYKDPLFYVTSTGTAVCKGLINASNHIPRPVILYSGAPMSSIVTITLTGLFTKYNICEFLITDSSAGTRSFTIPTYLMTTDGNSSYGQDNICFQYVDDNNIRIFTGQYSGAPTIQTIKIYALL